MSSIEEIIAGEILRRPEDRQGDNPYLLPAQADAKAILAAIRAAGYAVVPREPTEAMQIAGGKAHCQQIGCASDFEECVWCHGKATEWDGERKYGDGCVNGSASAYRAMIAASDQP